MRKSEIFGTIYEELLSNGKSHKLFTRNYLSHLIAEHQKYSSFVYEHSVMKNYGKMSLFFKRGIQIKN